jgi:transcriptional/translational regulatory protein YebC/TACO1
VFEWVPINKISLDSEKTRSVINFLETLEDDDDVQHVYANLEINNNIAEKIST